MRSLAPVFANMNFPRKFFVFLSVPLMAAIFAFAALWSIETDSPIRSNQVLWIATNLGDTAASTPESDPELSQKLEEEARIRHLNIAKVQDNRRSPVSGAELQLLVTNPDDSSRRLLEDGYRSFNPDYRVDVTEWKSRAEDPRAYYLLFGDRASIRGLADSLQRPEYTITQFALYSPSNIVRVYGLSPLTLALLSSLVAVFCTTFAASIAQSKKNARFRLAGWPVWHIVIQDIRDGVLPCGVGALGVFGAAAIALWFYNELASFDIYLAVSAALMAVYLTGIIASRLLALALLSLLPVPEALKGRKPTRLIYTLLFLLQVSCIFLVIGSVSAWFTDYGLVTSHVRAHNEWNKTPHAAFIPVTGSTSGGGSEESIGTWLASEASRSNLIVSQADVYQQDMDENGIPKSSVPIHYINSEYLRHHTIQGISEQIESGKRNGNETILAFVPEGIDPRYLATTSLLPVGVPENSVENARVLPAGEVGDVFTYGDVQSITEQFVKNPIVVYIPDEVLIKSPNTLYSWATGGGLLLLNGDEAIPRLHSSPADHYVASVLPGQALQSHGLTVSLSQLNLTGFAILVYSAVAAFACIAFAAAYCTARKDRLLRRELSGWRRFSAARTALIAESLAWCSVPVFTGALIMRAEDPMVLVRMSSATNDSYIRFMTFAGCLWGSMLFALSCGAISYFARRVIQEQGRIQ